LISLIAVADNIKWKKKHSWINIMSNIR
jgi:hypothetical protein